LIIIDGATAIFVTAFPPLIENYSTTSKKNDALQWASGRRWSVIGDLVTRLGKLAALGNCAIVLLSQCSTKIRPQGGAVLRSAISTKSWDSGINTRLLLFRDWLRHSGSAPQSDQHKNVRFAALLKLNGATFNSNGKAVAFQIKESGLHQIAARDPEVDPAEPLPEQRAIPILKRKREEIADSESEVEDEFGWAQEDDVLAVEDLAGESLRS
jgi:hypothetical protein